MRITIDCYPIQSPYSGRRGVGNLARDFLIKLIKTADNAEITLVAVNSLDLSEVKEIAQNPKYQNRIAIRTFNFIFTEAEICRDAKIRQACHRLYQKVIESTEPDIYINLSPMESEYPWMPISTVHNIAIFHDAIPAIFPERYLRTRRLRELYFENVAKLEEFDQLLCVSESSRNDCETVLGLARPNKMVINFGLQEFHRISNSAPENRDSELIFALLGQDSRKNKENLLKAWKIVADTQPTYRLKIAYGTTTDEQERNENLLSKTSLQESVEFLNYIENSELLNTYRRARLNVFPSQYEGLGLPILEAYAAGTPSVVSNRSSLPELCPDPRLQFNPEDPEQIARTILDFLDNPDLEKSAIKEGNAILEKFSEMNQSRQINQILEGFALNREREISNINPSARRLFFSTPLAPQETGIANFLEPIIHELHTRRDLLFVNPEFAGRAHLCPTCSATIKILSIDEFVRADKTESEIVYNLGNSKFHIFQYDLLQQFPGTLILHDLYFSGMLCEKFLPKGSRRGLLEEAFSNQSNLALLSPKYQNDSIGYISEQRLNRRIVESATSILVHSTKALEILEEDFLMASPELIYCTPLPVAIGNLERQVSNTPKVVGVFGRIAESKMVQEIVAAWKISQTGRSGEYVLRFVGEMFSTQFADELAKLPTDLRIEYTKDFSAEIYEENLSKVSFAIQLRRSSRGEASGALLDVVANSVPVIINDLQIAPSVPIDDVRQVPKHFRIEELAEAIDELASNSRIFTKKAEDARTQLLERSTSKTYVDTLLKTIERGLASSPMMAINTLATESPTSRFRNSKRINKLIEAHLESSRKNFAYRRLLVELDEKKLTKETLYLSKIMDYLEALEEKKLSRIYLVVRIEEAFKYRSVHNLFMRANAIKMVPSSEYEFWQSDSNSVMTLKSVNDHSVLNDQEYEGLRRITLDLIKVHP